MTSTHTQTAQKHISHISTHRQVDGGERRGSLDVYSWQDRVEMAPGMMPDPLLRQHTQVVLENTVGYRARVIGWSLGVRGHKDVGWNLVRVRSLEPMPVNVCLEHHIRYGAPDNHLLVYT
jgi:hypothetical protein